MRLLTRGAWAELKPSRFYEETNPLGPRMLSERIDDAAGDRRFWMDGVGPLTVGEFDALYGVRMMRLMKLRAQRRGWAQ